MQPLISLKKKIHVNSSDNSPIKIFSNITGAKNTKDNTPVRTFPYHALLFQF